MKIGPNEVPAWGMTATIIEYGRKYPSVVAELLDIAAQWVRDGGLNDDRTLRSITFTEEVHVPDVTIHVVVD